MDLNSKNNSNDYKSNFDIEPFKEMLFKTLAIAQQQQLQSLPQKENKKTTSENDEKAKSENEDEYKIQIGDIGSHININVDVTPIIALVLALIQASDLDQDGIKLTCEKFSEILKSLKF